MEHDEFEGKVAIVTGGASGIGRATVETLRQRGASVVIADVRDGDGTELARALGARARFDLVDVSDPEQIAALVERTVADLGGVDIMVNNAAVSSPLRSLLDDDLADFHRIMSVNVLGVMAGTKFAARHMADHAGGSIVNMTSIGGILAGGGVMTYRASKAAVIQFTKSAAIELAHYEIRVNAIAPGNIRTAIVRKSAAGADAEQLEQFEEKISAQMRADRPVM